MRPWLECLLADLPGLALFDAHTHTGSNDPDGFRADGPELVAALGAAGARAVVFTTMEPGGYREANDRVLAEAGDSDGVLVPFCRVDPHHGALAEAERCLAAGARGIKLHPRAEGFELDLPAVEPLFELAGERRLPVLIHAGRGIPALGRHVVSLCERHPGARAILAHAGICDLAWIWREAPRLPNLFFDTSWYAPADLLALFALVPPGQVLFASDSPYGTPTLCAAQTLRCAIEAGLAEEQIAVVMGRQIERLLAGEDPIDAGPAPGGPVPLDPLLERVYGYLVPVMVAMLGGHAAPEQLALARLACEVGEDAPQAPVCRSVLALLERVDRYAAVGEPIGFGMAPSVHLGILACTLARTPSAPLPVGVEDVTVGERAP